MRTKTRKLVVTFATTSDAMACEAHASASGLPGRLIPVPTEIDAGCGLAWCSADLDGAALRERLAAAGLAFEGIYPVMLY